MVRVWTLSCNCTQANGNGASANGNGAHSNGNGASASSSSEEETGLRRLLKMLKVRQCHLVNPTFFVV
jgi:hypothetical protein